MEGASAITILVFGVLRRSALGWRDEHLAAGTAANEASEALHFDGWLELLRVLSELVATAPSSGADPATGAASWCRAVSGQTQPAVPAANASSTWAWIIALWQTRTAPDSATVYAP